MISLHNRQSEFATALLDPACDVPSGLLGPDGQPSARRFGVYRNNVIVGLVDALQDAYPAVCRLVGEAFFQAMARVYVMQEPPESPVLLYYGAGFPQFLEGFVPVQELPYLPDVARMERAWVEAYHAQEAEPLSVERLEEVTQEDLLRLRFRFHPSARLISSAYPALTIWSRTMGEFEDAEIELAGCDGEDVLIVRPEAYVEVRRLLHGHAFWIRELMLGKTILAATSDVFVRLPGFDPAAALAVLVEASALLDFYVHPAEETYAS